MFKLCPQKKKTVCVASFGDNIFYVTRSLRSESDEDIIILKDKSCHYPFDTSTSKELNFEITHPFSFLQSIYHLATATTILVDNYFGFLAVTNFKKGTTCIQLWHAAGAIKLFGLMDPSSKTRSKRAIDRFRRVYRNFHYTAVGSERMAAIFQDSFDLSNDAIIRTGIPRTDFFYHSMEKQQIGQKLRKSYPIINKKKVILYAPTFRDDELSNFQLQLDIKKLYEALSGEYVLFIKHHPAVTYKLKKEYNDFVYDVSDYHEINHLLLIADILISDYSSIPFEYSLLNKPMIFFAYDLEDYQRTRGLLKNYQSEMPGPITFTTEEIVQSIKRNAFDKAKIKAFASQWNEYSKGRSSRNIVNIIVSTEGAPKKKEALF